MISEMINQKDTRFQNRKYTKDTRFQKLKNTKNTGFHLSFHHYFIKQWSFLYLHTKSWL